MKSLISTLVIGIFLGGTQLVSAQAIYNYNNSPNNWQNSPNNWQNSPNNWQNSPNNWQNSPNNYTSSNGIYDNRGNRIGYGVQSPSGVVNYFDNSGNRIGYMPKN